MLGGHLDHYLHRQCLLRKGVKDKTIELWRFVEQEGGFGFDPARNQGRPARCQHRQRELNYDGCPSGMANIQNAMW
jgi:predicted RNA-binding protein YlxR (DUF448 family)